MGIYLPERSMAFKEIDAELEREDSRLVLDVEPDHRFGLPCYFVVCHVAGDKPPVRIVEWRDELGRPLPLSSGILWRVRSQRARGGVAAQEALAANEAMVAAALREADEEMDAIADDVGARISGKRSPAFHRGQHLRRSRDKRRARGEQA